ncbi:MAG TPA: sugar phosphate isomerase/epimerase [Thermomicrobiales bacterium]|nr:sugar phosphate isomerase/epimerase [Thermomicrobiales bacterium]
MVRFGMSTGIGAGQPLAALRQSLERVAGVGFTHAEILSRNISAIFNGQINTARLETLKEAIAGSPIAFTLHGSEITTSRGGNLMDISTSTERLIFEADLALARTIGASIVVYHSGTLRDIGNDTDAARAGMAAERETLRAMGDIAGESGITIAVENRVPIGRTLLRHGYGISLERLADQINEIDHPQVGVCLDTGHAFLGAAYLGYDFLEQIRLIAPLVSHIHFADNFGKVQLDERADPSEDVFAGLGDLHLLPGWGAIPFGELEQIAFPRRPIVNLELRPQFVEHLQLASDTTRAFAERIGN